MSCCGGRVVSEASCTTGSVPVTGNCNGPIPPAQAIVSNPVIVPVQSVETCECAVVPKFPPGVSQAVEKSDKITFNY